jgi:hypothetical protein
MGQMSHKSQALIQSNAKLPEENIEAAALPANEQVTRAILKTILYSDLFDFPLTPEEIAHYLIAAPGSKSQDLDILRDLARLDGWISQVDGFVTLPGREIIIAGRRLRSEISRRSWRKARFYARILGCLPFVRMVGVTGALAMDNSEECDDVDILLVTAPHRVWLARAMSLLLVYAGKLTPRTLCPNYVISEESLALEPHTIYVAHEFVQMVPLYGFETYQKMRALNPWIKQMLPNAAAPLHYEPEYRPGKIGRCIKGAMERLLAGRMGERLDIWEMRRKIRKFSARMALAHGSVIFDRNQVKGHFDDHGTRISLHYQRQLDEFRLSASEGESGEPAAKAPGGAAIASSSA